MTEPAQDSEPLAALLLPVAALPGASLLVWLGVPQTRPCYVGLFLAPLYSWVSELAPGFSWLFLPSSSILHRGFHK